MQLPEVDTPTFLKCGMLAYGVIALCQVVSFVYNHGKMAWYSQIQALGGIFFALVLILFFYGMYRSQKPQNAPIDVLAEFGEALKEMVKK